MFPVIGACTMRKSTAKIAHSSAVLALLVVAFWGALSSDCTPRDGELYRAISRGDSQRALRLIERGADPNAPKDNPPIFWAAYIGDADLVEALLSAGAEVNVFDEDLGVTPLHTAAFRGHADVVRVLVAHGADVNLLDRRRRSVLERGVMGGHEETVRFLVDNGAHLSESNSFVEMAIAGDVASLEVMIRQGIPVDSRVEESLTALHCAVVAGRIPTAELLLRNGANVGAEADNGRTPLHLAASGGNHQTVTLLLAAGADPNAVDSSGLTPLMCAAWMGREAVVAPLVKAGARLDATGREAGFTALHLAATAPGREHVVTALLQAGADPNVADANGRTALHQAAIHGAVGVARVLIQGGAAMIPDSNGTTPLMSAILSTSRSEIVRFLVEAGADVNARDKYGRTPLYYAAISGDASTARLLLGHGADPHSKDTRGRTPLYWARRRGNNAVAAVLRKNMTAP